MLLLCETRIEAGLWDYWTVAYSIAPWFTPRFAFTGANSIARSILLRLFLMVTKVSAVPESPKNRSQEIFRDASGHSVPLADPIELLGSSDQSLSHPLVRVADQFRQFGKGADLWDLGEQHIQSCLSVVDQRLVSYRLLWLGLNPSLHTLRIWLLAQKTEQ